MTREEKQKAIDALKISAPVMAVTQEKFNDYIQTLNKTMNWLEQEPKTGHWRHYEGGAYYIEDDLTTALSQDIYVNGWQELPKCREE